MDWLASIKWEQKSLGQKMLKWKFFRMGRKSTRCKGYFHNEQKQEFDYERLQYQQVAMT